MKVFILLNIFVFSCLSVSAQTGTLSGKVVDKATQEVLIGANVVISGTKYGAATDINGVYKIKDVSLGLYSVFASYVGYKKKISDSISVQSNSTYLNFDMELDSSSNDIIILDRPIVRFVRTCEPPYDFPKPRGLDTDTLKPKFNSFVLDSLFKK